MASEAIMNRTAALRVARLLPWALAASFTTGIAGAQTLGLGTTSPGGLVHSNGVAVAKVLVEKGGLKVVVQPRGGTSESDVNAGNTQTWRGSTRASNTIRARSSSTRKSASGRRMVGN